MCAVRAKACHLGREPIIEFTRDWAPYDDDTTESFVIGNTD
jgi:hypothetical protein